MGTAVYYFTTKIGPWLLLIIFGFIIPGIFTIGNVYNLFSKKPFMEKLISSLTIFIGGSLYWIVHAISHIKYDDWVGGTDPNDLYYSLSTGYIPAILIPVILGTIALLILLYSNTGKLPSAISALCISLVIILNVVGIFYAIQFTNKIDPNILYAFMYVYHINVLLVSFISIRKHLKVTGRSAIFIALASTIVVLELLFVLMGLGFSAPVKAFTETNGWTLSKQIK